MYSISTISKFPENRIVHWFVLSHKQFLFVKSDYRVRLKARYSAIAVYPIISQRIVTETEEISFFFPNDIPFSHNYNDVNKSTFYTEKCLQEEAMRLAYVEQ